MINQYFSEREFRFAKWFAGHKEQLRKILIIFLIIIDVGLFAFVGWKFGIYFLGKEEHEKIIQQPTQSEIDIPYFKEHFQPEELIVQEVQVLKHLSLSGEGRFNYSFLTKIVNPNEKWMISKMEYRFVYAGGTTESRETFILPQTEKYIFASGDHFANGPTNAELEIIDLQWKRVKGAEVDTLKILDKVYAEDVELFQTSSDERIFQMPEVTFIARNDSVHGFWEIPFLIVLYQDQRILDVNSIVVSRLRGGEKRQAELIWPYHVPGANRAEVFPQLNILDPDVFMKEE